MKRIRNLFYLSLFLTVPGLQAVAQEKLHVSLPDSITTVGYATGLRKNLSGLVERITENQMNKDQITNPLDAIRGDRKSTRLNSSHMPKSRMPSSA